jgi:ATP-dependent DNA helicase DinG
MRISGLVYFIEKESSEERVGQIELKAKALYVGSFMEAELFSQCSTVVQTSATLAIKGKGTKDFDHVKTEMGMLDLKGVEEITVPSPFDWHKQSILVVPDTMPLYPGGAQGREKDQEVEAYEQAALEHIVKIIKIVKGRTLVLFTSHKMLRKADEYIRPRVPYEVFTQGQGTNKDLQDQFRFMVDSVLLGTESFAEGVDIQGESLSCVILDKLSHVPPSDPVLIGLNMRNKRNAKEKRPQMDIFGRFRMPYAITKFKQRTGRLIRSVTDVGIMVCLDRRVLEANYSPMFIRSLPPIRIVKNLSEIAPFLRSVGAL